MFKMTDFKRCIFKHHTRIYNALLVQLVFTALCKWLGWALLNWPTQDIWLLCAHLTWSKTKLLINHKTAGAETETAPIVSTFLLHPCNLWFTCFWYHSWSLARLWTVQFHSEFGDRGCWKRIWGLKRVLNFLKIGSRDSCVIFLLLFEKLLSHTGLSN